MHNMLVQLTIRRHSNFAETASFGNLEQKTNKMLITDIIITIINIIIKFHSICTVSDSREVQCEEVWYCISDKSVVCYWSVNVKQNRIVRT